MMIRIFIQSISPVSGTRTKTLGTWILDLSLQALMLAVVWCFGSRSAVGREPVHQKHHHSVSQPPGFCSGSAEWIPSPSLREVSVEL